MTVGAERNQRLTGRTWSPSPRRNWSCPRIMRSLTRRSLRGQRRKNLVSFHKSLSSNKRFFELLNLYWRKTKISNLNVRKMTIFYNFTEHFSKVFDFGKISDDFLVDIGTILLYFASSGSCGILHGLVIQCSPRSVNEVEGVIHGLDLSHRLLCGSGETCRLRLGHSDNWTETQELISWYI